MSRRAWIRIAVVGAAVTLVASAIVGSNHARRNPDPAVTYVSSWDTSGVEVNPDGSWTTTTDLGYHVTVTGGSLTIFSVTMVPCPGDAATQSADPALLGVTHTSDLTDLATEQLGTVTGVAFAYCEGHIGWGVTNGDIALAAGVKPVTLEVHGTYTEPGTMTARDFVITSTLSWGAKVSLTRNGSDVVVEPAGAVELTVAGAAASLFDGIDFAETGEDADRAVFRNLAASTRFEVTAGTNH
jgi:hypothetical protein